MIHALAEAGKNTKNAVGNRLKIRNSKSGFIFKQRFFLTVLSSLLLSLSFSPLNLGILAWVSLVPFFLVLNEQSLKSRIFSAFIFGFLFFTGTIYWLAHVSVVGLICLSLYLSLFICVFAIFAKKITSFYGLFILPGIWISMEILRAYLLTGFGWALLGYTQFRNLMLIQMADKTGVWGISFLIVMVNTATTQIILKLPRVRWQNAVILLPVSLLLLTYAYGLLRLCQKFPNPKIKISIIQGNIPQTEKWDPQYIENILNQFSKLTFLAAKDQPDMIVWPETSVPGYLLDEPLLIKTISDLAKKINTYLLVGSPRESIPDKAYYNCAFLFSPDGQLLGFHDKIHLVPFGEYLPYEKFFGFFLENTDIADFSPGKSYSLFSLPDKQANIYQFAVLICFEDIFPDLVKRFRDKGADFLITISNEAWFKISAEPLQHLAISVFRAVENRCWFIRCANTGISGFIDPYGKIQGKVENNRQDIFISGVKSLSLWQN